ncbi:MAG: B12-binding domain-containing radical SAM protein, partial [Candidatus Hermodarchaeota archaeon]
ALLDLIEAMANKTIDIKQIPNIWSKNSEGIIYKNEVRPFIENLDELPISDFSIYAKYGYMMSYNLDMFPVITGRGCPYNCSYCFNKTYKNLYRQKGKYLRKRSPANVIQELVQAKMKYGIRKINFVDDSFLLFPAWIKEFSGLYKEKVKLPFIVNVEPTQVTEDLVRMIKDMGCICVRMGVETGNESLRRTVLNKKVSNHQLIEAAGFIKRHGIKLTTYNMLGLPGETLENAIETYLLNKEIGTDFVQCSLLQPYPGTAINRYVKEKGFSKDHNDQPVLDESFFVNSRIKLENEKEITNIQKLMQVFIQLHIPMLFVRLIIRLPDNPLFHLIFRLSFIYNKIRTQKLEVISLFRLGLHSLSYMKHKKLKSP